MSSAEAKRVTGTWCYAMELVALSAELNMTAYCDRDSREVRECIGEVLGAMPVGLVKLAQGEGVAALGVAALAHFTDGSGFGVYMGRDNSSGGRKWSVALGAGSLQAKPAKTCMDSWGFVLMGEALALGVQCDDRHYEVIVYFDGDVRVLARMPSSFEHAAHLVAWVETEQVQRFIANLWQSQRDAENERNPD